MALRTPEEIEDRSRAFALLLAVIVCLLGTGSFLWAVLFQHLPGEAGPAMWQSEDRCVGHHCADVLTCRGSREASFHFREITWLVTAGPFGYWGILGALYKHPRDLRWFGSFFFAFAGLLALLVLGDGIYTFWCGDYPLNVVDEGLLWIWPRVPVREAVKMELRDAMSSYPVAIVDTLAKFNVFGFYALVELSTVALFLYFGNRVLHFAAFLDHGEHGLGANYSIRDWRERVILKHEIKDLLRAPDNPDYKATASA